MHLLYFIPNSLTFEFLSFLPDGLDLVKEFDFIGIGNFLKCKWRRLDHVLIQA